MPGSPHCLSAHSRPVSTRRSVKSPIIVVPLVMPLPATLPVPFGDIGDRESRRWASAAAATVAFRASSSCRGVLVARLETGSKAPIGPGRNGRDSIEDMPGPGRVENMSDRDGPRRIPPMGTSRKSTLPVPGVQILPQIRFLASSGELLRTNFHVPPRGVVGGMVTEKRECYNLLHSSGCKCAIF